MRITKIDQQAKDYGRYSIFVDDKYSFSLTRDQLSSLNLKVGQELSRNDLKKLKDDSSFGKLRDQTYRWLSIRPRSAWEIQDYLKRKTKDEVMQKKIIDLLAQQGYVNDESFAQKWINNRRILKPISKYRLKQELIQKRVPIDIINSQIDEADLDEASAVRVIIAKRANHYSDQQKLIAYLSRQGFNYQVIKEVLSEDK